MSLVGPRPIVDEELAVYQGSRTLLLSMRPGITGAWAVSGRHCVGYPERCDLELWYVREWKLLLDVKILLATVGAVVSARAAETAPGNRACKTASGKSAFGGRWSNRRCILRGASSGRPLKARQPVVSCAVWADSIAASHHVDHFLHREPELLVDLLVRRARAEPRQARARRRRCRPTGTSYIGCAASIATRGTPAGSTDALIRRLAAARTAPWLGMLTTRAGTPCSASFCCACDDRAPTSEPLDISTTCGVAALRRRRARSAPFATPVGAARTSSRSMKPSFWRVSTSATGPCSCSTATRHASAVSVASAGRITRDVRESRAAPTAARSAGASGRPRRGRSSRACRCRSRAAS